MIQQTLNGMITLMLAKFVLNEVPHVMGLLDDSGSSKSWVEPAWAKTCVFAQSYGVHLQSAYERFVLIQPELDLQFPAIAALTPSILPSSSVRAKDTKTLVAGYWLIANDLASDEVVNDVHLLLLTYYGKSEKAYMETMGMSYEEMAEETADFALEGFLPVLGLIKSAKTRADKAIAIDAFMQCSHLGYSSGVEAWSIAEMFLLEDEDGEPYFKAIWGLLSALEGSL